MGNCFGEPEAPQPRRRPQPGPPNPAQPSGRPQERAQAQSQPQRRPQTASAPINSPLKPSHLMDREEIVLGSSASERRELMDNDTRWKRLLDSTTTNLIDISQTTQPLDGADAQQREKEHRNLMNQVPFPVDGTAIFKLPSLNIPKGETEFTLEVSAHDKEFMQKCGHEVALAVSNMTVEHQGDIVVSFDSLN